MYYISISLTRSFIDFLTYICILYFYINTYKKSYIEKCGDLSNNNELK